MALWVFRAEPTKVIAFGKLNDDGLDMEYNGELHFPNGGITKFKVSCLTSLSNKATIKGSKGEIVVSRLVSSRPSLHRVTNLCHICRIKNVLYDVGSGANGGGTDVVSRSDLGPPSTHEECENSTPTGYISLR